MVKVKIPFDTPARKQKGKKTKDEDSDDVGIMSDSGESEVDDDIEDPDWEEVKDQDDDDDEFPYKPGKMPKLPENGVTISIEAPTRASKRGRGRKANGRNEDDEDSDDAATKPKLPKQNNSFKSWGDKQDSKANSTSDYRNPEDFPRSESAFKNHEKYVLEKHLLKFQGIYPPEVVPLGYFKDFPVYPRECVQTLRSRETWLQRAKVVKLNESPYKIVNARPKRDKYTGDIRRDLPLELFGEWQVEDYDPPAAENGKIPRNAYGNVDMYQECMLPKKCVWLKLPGLQRIATKLGIDCAAAVVGFDRVRGGYGFHPKTEGFVVCEEHADTLRDAWVEEQENVRKKEEEKRLKRIWDNWKRLIKAAMIRERLKVKYKHS